MKIGGGEQVSDNSMCTSRRWRSGGVAVCVVGGMGLLAAVIVSVGDPKMRSAFLVQI